MRLEEFISSVSPDVASAATSAALRALCLDRQNLWDQAHEAIQDEQDTMSAAVHAYLHRKEGDIWNANYWYRQAGRKPFKGSLDAEWRALVEEECARMGVRVRE
ncbi:MAG: hypothetical protein ACK5HO_09335 [Pseudomonadota bacterium]|jgi:hypothetical protein